MRNNMTIRPSSNNKLHMSTTKLKQKNKKTSYKLKSFGYGLNINFQKKQVLFLQKKYMLHKIQDKTLYVINAHLTFHKHE